MGGYHYFFPILFTLSLWLSPGSVRAQFPDDAPFPYDTLMHKFMIRGEFEMKNTERDKLFSLTYFCFDSLYDVGNNYKFFPKSGKMSNLGAKSSLANRWAKSSYRIRIGSEADSMEYPDTFLQFTTVFTSIDNTVMYQHRDFRLIIEDREDHFRQIGLEKAMENGYTLKKGAKLINDFAVDMVENIRLCMLEYKEKGQYRPKNPGHHRYEGVH